MSRGRGRKDYNCTEVYDPRTEHWTALRPMLEKRRRHRAAVVEESIYVLLWTRCVENRGVALFSAEVLNPEQGDWVQVANMFRARGVLGGKPVAGRHGHLRHRAWRLHSAPSYEPTWAPMQQRPVRGTHVTTLPVCGFGSVKLVLSAVLLISPCFRFQAIRKNGV